jgi:hypothetical protein
MNKMVRKQFFITAEQNKRLKAQAAATGVSEAELVRAGIDLQLERKAEKTDWRRLADSLSGAWAERDDLDEILRKNRKGWKRRLKRLGLSGD